MCVREREREREREIERERKRKMSDREKMDRSTFGSKNRKNSQEAQRI